MIESRLFRTPAVVPATPTGSCAELFGGALPDTETDCVLSERHSDLESHQPFLCDKAVQLATALRMGDVGRISR
ncbi:hypothetical protein [Microbulbifer rhizosphaerae]|uniref:Uncharacterized protein n=1 Tax=Microbulbifer rhizosphaerae TaxID=1562603 RepID=A0A7W4ZA17_9GAMM|nr:hypothetical protein [Microbulbifer rhizosphaerae]MBB3060869.1 hypothetical protein [Microbulbifer rhizosphaerae]